MATADDKETITGSPPTGRINDDRFREADHGGRAV
jgi:hypothetical protein